MTTNPAHRVKSSADSPRRFAGRGLSFWFWVVLHISWIVAVLLKVWTGQPFF